MRERVRLHRSDWLREEELNFLSGAYEAPEVPVLYTRVSFRYSIARAMRSVSSPKFPRPTLHW